MEAEFTPELAVKTLIRLKGRAERLEPDQVVESFSSVGPLEDLLSTEDHQVIFGRRGTGKTHALRFLFSTRLEAGDCPLYVDMRNLGSDGSIYADPNLPINDRATRLLLDSLAFIQDGILDYVFHHPNADLNAIERYIDAFNDACAEVRVVGEMTATHEEASGRSDTKESGISAWLRGSKPGGELRANISNTTNLTETTKRQVAGVEKLAVRFPNLSSALRDLCNALPAKRLWIILDEWSSVPEEVQPFLADMRKRRLAPTGRSG